MRLRTAGLVFLGLAIGASCQAETLFVSLRPVALVDRTEFRLADISEIVGRQRQAIDQLGNLIVGRCARLTQPCHLTKGQISAAVQPRASELGIDLVWGSVEAVDIHGRSRSVSLTTAIDQTAIRLVQAMDSGYPLAIGVKDGPAAVDVPPGAVQIEPQFARMRRVGALIEMPIDVLVDGSVMAQPIVRYVLRKGSAPSTIESRVPTEEFDTKTTELSSEKRVAERVAVSRNEKVRLLIATGPLRIEAEGIALAAAHLGAAVRVRRADGVEDVEGRAVGQGTVLVEEN